MTHSSRRATFAISAIVAILGGCSVCTGCGSSSSYDSATPSRGGSSGGTATTSGEATGSNDSSGGAQSTVPSSGTTAGAIPGTNPPRTTGIDNPQTNGGGAEPMVSRDEQISQWATRLAAAEQQLQASPAVCNNVCRATESICGASRELCALTGDRVGAPPTDPRCARARASCDRATRQRNEACVTCPTD